MSRNDLARRRLKEVRTLEGFDAAYKLAGLPDDGAKRNTKVKRLSRVINRKTGGYTDLTPQQRKRINRSYKGEGRQKRLASGRSKAYIREENKSRAKARAKARRDFGADGLNPNPRRLQRRLNQYKNLSNEEKERIEESFVNIEADGGKAMRREYARSVSTVRFIDIPEAERKDQKRRIEKANRAVWRDEGKNGSFEDWEKEWLKAVRGEGS